MDDTLRGAALLERLRSIPAPERDRWVDDLLGLDALPPDGDLPRGSVPYLPSGVDEIVAVVTEAPVGPEDVFVDLGSGLGKVVMLANLLSGAIARGIEIQEALVHEARARCGALGLDGVSFVHADAAEIDLDGLDGTVFYLYAPFNGEMLARVIARIEAVARRHPITVAAVGLELAVPWLAPRATSCPSLTIYDSRP